MAPFDASASWPSAPAEPDHFPERFKDALANLASGVAIISCWDGDTPRGLLVSSITGLSVEPPRFLFCVRKEAACHDILVGSDLCGVAILADHDLHEAQRFASSHKVAERFCSTRWTLSRGRPPIFSGGLSRAICRIDQVINAATHSILIVSAEEIALADKATPLVSFSRTFHSLGNSRTA